jgi:hypothetical protein
MNFPQREPQRFRGNVVRYACPQRVVAEECGFRGRDVGGKHLARAARLILGLVVEHFAGRDDFADR